MRKSQMNVENIACASSAAVEHWDQIDWKRCERQVARLQARIVKASQMGRWSKIKALQRLLTCSFSGKALAVKRVTENKGRASHARNMRSLESAMHSGRGDSIRLAVSPCCRSSLIRISASSMERRFERSGILSGNP